MNIYRHFSAVMKYFSRLQNPRKDVHRPSPSGFCGFATRHTYEKQAFFADRHTKVKQSEHLLFIVFIYLEFLWINERRGEGRASAMFTK